MTALALDPHGDDLVLFACYTALREKPHVVVVNPTLPLSEIEEAMEVLGLTWESWSCLSGKRPDWDAFEKVLGSVDAERVLAPSYDFEGNGHVEGETPTPGWGVLQHDSIGLAAHRIFKERYSPYCLYTRWHGRVTGTEVVPSAKEIALKLRALSCFESQIEQPSTRPWFTSLLDLREWIV